MNPSSLNLSPIKDGRRILGEKSANACLSPVGKRTAVDSTPVKRTALHENSSPPKKLLPSPTFVSRKRSIDQVEDIQTDNGSLPAQRVPPAQLHETGSPQPTIIDSSQVSLQSISLWERTIWIGLNWIEFTNLCIGSQTMIQTR